MTQMIFLNLPVKDLDASKKFYSALGWKRNEEFSDENAACFVVEDNICVMLVTHQFFTSLSGLPVTEVGNSAAYALTLPSREAVDDIADRARAAGGRDASAPDEAGRKAQEEMEGMYGRSFYDLDGHRWEPIHMAIPAEAS